MPDDDDVVPMALCPHCEHLVPEANLALHETRCQGRKRPARDTNNNNDGDENSSDVEQYNRYGSAIGRNSPDNEPDEKRPFLPRASWEAPSQPRGGVGNEITIDDDGDGESFSSVMEDSDNSTSPVAAAAAAAAPRAAAEAPEVIDLMGDDEGVAKWTCPRCTLLNPITSGACEACSYRRPESERPADPTRREQLIGGTPPQLGGGGGYIGSAALLGGLVGGTGAYMRGQSLSSGLLNGALTGAVGGAVLNDLANSLQQQRTMHSSTSSNGPMYSSYSMMRTPDGRVYTSSSGNGAAAYRGNAAAAAPPVQDINQQLLQLLQATQFARGGVVGMPQHANPDQMSYDQLLQMFGTGTDNLGANEGQIRMLPSSTIEDVEKLPPDSRQCSICLEEFKSGDKRKIMPCLHGFHENCLDQWLHTNGSCPICKHRLNSSE